MGEKMLYRNRTVQIRNIIDIFSNTEHAPIVSKNYSKHAEDSNWIRQLMIKYICTLFEIWKLCSKLQGEVQRTKDAELDSLKISKLKANYDNLLSHLNFKELWRDWVIAVLKWKDFFAKKSLFWFCKIMKLHIPGESVIFAAKKY